MKKHSIFFLLLVFAVVATGLRVRAQYTVMAEDIGNPSGIIALASYSGWQNNGVYTYSSGGQANSADVRNTIPSGAYTGASGGGNVSFSAGSGNYGFSVEGIDASFYTSLSLQFGYRKESASGHAGFSVEFWNGSAWVVLANTAAALFNESGTAAVSWYAAKPLSLPAAAQISGLKLRFVKSGTRSIRVDDIKLTGTPTAPVLNITAAPIFGSQCIGTMSSPQSVAISGMGLNGTDIMIGPLNGYSFSLTANGVYNSMVVITNYGGSSLAATNVFIQFNPGNGGSYDGNIPVNGGGIINDTIPVSGAGINTVPALSTGATTGIGSTHVICEGTVSSNGCSAVSSYGIEYSLDSGFANGTGTQVAGSAIVGGVFSVPLTLLTPGSTYYYKAYAVNNGGTAYGALQSFPTLSLPAPSALSTSTLLHTGFTAHWAPVTDATEYRLDISTGPGFSVMIPGYADLAVTDTFLVVAGLTPNQDYYFRIRAYASAAVSVNSATLNVLTYKNPSTAAFQTRANGLFSDPASWEYNYTGTAFIPASQLPGAGNGVSILSGYTIDLDAPAAVRSLMLDGILNDNGHNLTVKGNISGNGKHTSSDDGKLVLKGNAGQTIIGGAGTDTLRLDNVDLDDADGFLVNGNVTLEGTLSLSLGTLNTTGANLTLLSSNVKTARVGRITGGEIVGPVTTERYIPAKRAWRFVSSAVNSAGNILNDWQEGGATPAGYGSFIMGGAADVINGLDLNPTGQRSMFRFDSYSQSWLPVTNTIANNLVAGEGYRMFLRGDRTIPLNQNPLPVPNETRLRATGTLLTGTVVFGGGSNSSNPSSLPSLADTAGQFTLIGNPYACPVDWESLAANPNNTGINPNYYWAWDAKINGSNGRGGFVVYETGTGPMPPSEVDRYIQSGQAIFLQTIASNPRIEFRETDKAGSDTHVFKTTAGDSRVVMRLFLQDTLFADAAVVKYDNSYSNTIGFEDALKLMNLDENLSVVVDTIRLSVDARPEIILTDTVLLKLEQLGGSSYTMKCFVQNLPAGLQGYVIDKYLNQTTVLDMTGETAVAFAVTSDTASAATDRFYLIFSTLPLSQSNQLKLAATLNGNNVLLECSNTHEHMANEYRFERSGDGIDYKQIAALTASGNDNQSHNYTAVDQSPEQGDNYYRVKLIKVNGDVLASETLKVAIPLQTADLVVFPNPVCVKELKLKFQGLKKGVYTIAVIDPAGTIVLNNQLEHSGGPGSLSFHLPAGISDGNYTVRLSGENLNITRPIVVNLNSYK